MQYHPYFLHCLVIYQLCFHDFREDAEDMKHILVLVSEDLRTVSNYQVTQQLVLLLCFFFVIFERQVVDSLVNELVLELEFYYFTERSYGVVFSVSVSLLRVP